MRSVCELAQTVPQAQPAAQRALYCTDCWVTQAGTIQANGGGWGASKNARHSLGSSCIDQAGGGRDRRDMQHRDRERMNRPDTDMTKHHEREKVCV